MKNISLIDRIMAIDEEIERDGGFEPRCFLTTEERIELDEKFAALTHREALALSLSSTSYRLVRDLIEHEREDELLDFITPELLNDADDVIRQLSPKTGIVSIFDGLCYPEVLDELCDKAPLVFFYRISEGLEASAKRYADSVLSEIPVSH